MTNSHSCIHLDFLVCPFGLLHSIPAMFQVHEFLVYVYKTQSYVFMGIQILFMFIDITHYI